MPSEKSARQSERNRQRNRAAHSAVHTTATHALRVLQGGSDPQEAEAAVQRAITTLDRAAQKGILHRNTVSRKKSRLMAQLHALKTKGNQK
ncbi:MAG: 30S ribosomal protein S20 [Dehalococcoidia bacterium]